MTGAQHRTSPGKRRTAYGPTMKFDEYRAHDAIALAGLVAARQVSAAELLTVAQERAAEVNPQINAIVAGVPVSRRPRPISSAAPSPASHS